MPSFISKSYENKSDNTKYLYPRRLENINAESGLEEKRRKIDHVIRDNKVDIKKLYSQLGALKKELEALEIEIEYLTNHFKYSKFEPKFNNTMYDVKKKSELSDIDAMIKMKIFLEVKY